MHPCHVRQPSRSGGKLPLLLMLMQSALPSLQLQNFLMRAQASAFCSLVHGTLLRVQMSPGLPCLQLGSFANACTGCCLLYLGI